MKKITATLATLTAALLVVMFLAGNAPAASYKLVVNRAVDVEVLSRKAASDLFLKKTTKWENGAAVVPVDLIDSSEVRDSFSKQVLGRPTAAVKSYWNQQIFSGRDVPPVEKKSDDEVLSFVRSTPGSVGYISPSASADGVRVVSIN